MQSPHSAGDGSKADEDGCQSESSGGPFPPVIFLHNSESRALVGSAVSSSSSSTAFRAVAFAAFISSLTAATLGYDVGIIAAAIDYINSTLGLNHFQTQLVVGSLNFVSAFGTLIAGFTSDALGRKATVWICCLFYIIGTACMALALSYEVLLVGRIVTGLGVGISFVVVPVYITEITPSEARGMLSTCFDLSINIGILLGYLTGFFVAEVWGKTWSENTRWRVMLGLGVLLPGVVMACLPWLPESPRWLMSRGCHKEAITALTKFLGDAEVARETIRSIKLTMDEDTGLTHDGTGAVRSDEEAVNRMSPSSPNAGCRLASSNPLSKNDDAGVTLVLPPEIPQSLISPSSAVACTVARPLSWREVLHLNPLLPADAYLQRVILLVVGIGFWQQATGSEAVLYYSAAFLKKAGLDSVSNKRCIGPSHNQCVQCLTAL